jgi:hypothetical protein
MFKPLVFAEKINLSSDQTKKEAGSKLRNLIQPVINSIVNEVMNDTFEYDPFSFEKNKRSKLTNRNGIYLIINKAKKRVYLGSSSDLARRKSDQIFKEI